MAVQPSRCDQVEIDKYRTDIDRLLSNLDNNAEAGQRAQIIQQLRAKIEDGVCMMYNFASDKAFRMNKLVDNQELIDKLKTKLKSSMLEYAELLEENRKLSTLVHNSTTT